MFVQPIRDKAIIEKMKNTLLKNSLRDYMLFETGINTGLRISDILELKVKDVKGSHISLTEKKTSKHKKFIIANGLRRKIDRYIEGMDDDSYLFVSQKGKNKPISRIQAYRILNDAATKVGISEIGTHTLRKTFGYHYYQKTKDVAMLQKLFSHSSPSITLIYIGINQDIMDEALKDFDL
jgi:integrase